MQNYFCILNTENNQNQGLSYGHTDERPGETVDYIEKRLVHGVEYSAETPDEVVQIIESCRIAKKIGRNPYRLKFAWGDAKTGQDWGETFDVAGYVGNSTGNKPIPLLIPRIDSIGGGAILDNCIVKISMAKGGQVLWQHPNYQPPKQ